MSIFDDIEAHIRELNLDYRPLNVIGGLCMLYFTYSLLSAMVAGICNLLIIGVFFYIALRMLINLRIDFRFNIEGMGISYDWNGENVNHRIL